MKRVGAIQQILVGLVLLILTALGTTLGSGAATAAPVSTREQAVNLVIARGLAQRGVPYSWAGGFDSSGLMQYIFAGVNAKLPRSSGAMYNVGQKVTPAQALPADLIFYGPEGTTTVTMFLGNNQMLEVGDAGVTVSPVRTDDMAPYLVRIIA